LELGLETPPIAVSLLLVLLDLFDLDLDLFHLSLFDDRFAHAKPSTRPAVRHIGTRPFLERGARFRLVTTH
jgi:hypothetical protein